MCADSTILSVYPSADLWSAGASHIWQASLFAAALDMDESGESEDVGSHADTAAASVAASMSTYNVLLEPTPDPVDAACIKLCAGLIVLSRDAVPQISRIAQNCLHSLVPPTDPTPPPTQPPPTPSQLSATVGVAAGPLAPGGPSPGGPGGAKSNLARALANAERANAVGVGVRTMGSTETASPLGPQPVTPRKGRQRWGSLAEEAEAEMAVVREDSE